MNLIYCVLWCCLLWGTSAYKSSFRRLVGVGKPNTPVTTRSLMIENKWFEQKVDHFNAADTRTWEQKYQMNSKFYKLGGPVFLSLGGEEEILSHWMYSGAWIEYAQQCNAMCFQLEHRFYGSSFPTENLNNTNIVYLSVEQALADFSTFIHTISRENEKLLPNSKWVVFGGSYSGSLAAWLRLKYPHLVYAAVSSSSALHSKMEFKEYFMVAQKLLSDVKPKCSSNIKEATIMISDLLKTNNGAIYVGDKLNTCQAIEVNNKKDITQLFKNLSILISRVIQYNKDNRYYDNVQNSVMSTEELCGMMSDKLLGSPLERYAAVHKQLRTDNDLGCLSVDYSGAIVSYKKTSLDARYVISGDRQWLYQLCTELGSFVTSNDENNLFSNTISLDFFTETCSDIFGKLFNKKALFMAVKTKNKMFNELKKRTRRIIYVHGSLDPWSKLGLTQLQSKKSVSIVVEGVAHCADIYPSSPTDPPQLTEARKTVARYLKTWLRKSDA